MILVNLLNIQSIKTGVLTNEYKERKTFVSWI